MDVYTMSTSRTLPLDECEVGKRYKLLSSSTPPNNVNASHLTGKYFVRHEDRLRFYFPSSGPGVPLPTEDWGLGLRGVCELADKQDFVQYNTEPFNDADYKLTCNDYEEMERVLAQAMTSINQLEAAVSRLSQGAGFIEPIMDIRGNVLKSISLLREAKQ